jgi:DNA polymerase/3'-5' exonuclease PolX
MASMNDAKIAEFRRTGTIGALEELRVTIPPGVRELTRVPGLGPKRANTWPPEKLRSFSARGVRPEGYSRVA